MSRTRVRTLVILTLALAGCSTGPDGLDPHELTGTWVIEWDPPGTCFTDLAIHVPSDNADRARDDAMNVFGAAWGFTAEDVGSDPNKTVTGHFDLNAETFRLVLWQKGFRAEFSGNVEPGPRLRGTLDGPRGMLSAFVRCRAEAIATR